jgi:hypothetical protein
MMMATVEKLRAAPAYGPDAEQASRLRVAPEGSRT